MKFSSVWHKCQLVLIVALGTVSVPLLLFAYLAEEMLPYAWLFPAIYVFLVMIGFKIPGKIRLPYGIAGLLLMGMLRLLAVSHPPLVQNVTMGIGLFYGILLISSLQIAGWGADKELPPLCIGSCLVPQLIGQFLLFVDGEYYEALVQSGPWMTAALFAFSGLVMLSMNRKSQTLVSGKRQDLPAAMRGKNALMTLALFALATMASLIPSFMVGMIKSFQWISSWIHNLLESLRPDDDLPALTLGTTAPTETFDPGFMEEIQGDSTVAQITFIVICVVAALILLPLVILALITVVKYLRRTARFLWERIMETAYNASDEYYEDEVSDTREEGQWEKTERTRGSRLKAAFVNEQKMSAVERVRYRYKRLVGKHKEWQAGSTARENLPLESAVIYERARYSSHPVTEEEAARFKEKTKRI